jgi:hypothetical protein
MVRTGAPPLVEDSLLRLGASSEGSARRSSSTMEPPGAKGDPYIVVWDHNILWKRSMVAGGEDGLFAGFAGLAQKLAHAGALVRLTGYVETSGADLDAPLNLLTLFEGFIHWQPIPPRDAKQLAEVHPCRIPLWSMPRTAQRVVGEGKGYGGSAFPGATIPPRVRRRRACSFPPSPSFVPRLFCKIAPTLPRGLFVQNRRLHKKQAYYLGICAKPARPKGIRK